jgi:hypothetical protein
VKKYEKEVKKYLEDRSWDIDPQNQIQNYGIQYDTAKQGDLNDGRNRTRF